jgi:thymidine kinase
VYRRSTDSPFPTLAGKNEVENATSQQYTMSLDLVLGPMWAGKSSYIIGKIRRYRAIGWNVLVVANPLDDRYGSQVISSHDKEQVAALAIADLDALYEDTRYKEARLLVIEEAQFYSGLYAFVKTAVERDKKHVVCVGLDGDAFRKPFGEILSLIPICDNVEKIKSLCAECGDGTPALFSHRHVHTNESAQIQVGAETTYIPLCRSHYLEKNASK